MPEPLTPLPHPTGELAAQEPSRAPNTPGRASLRPTDVPLFSELEEVAPWQPPRTAHAPSAGPLQVYEARGRAAFDALALEWDALAARTDDQVFHRHGYLRCWLDHFAPRARLRVLTARSAEGRLAGALVLLEQRRRQYGVRVRQLASASNEHSGRFDMLAEDPEAVGRAFLAHLAQDESWDVLRVTHVYEGGAAWALLPASEAAGMPAGVWHSGQSPYVQLPATLEALAQEKRKNRKTLRRKRRRLEERGKVTVDRVDGGEALDLWLEEGFRIERSGWKAKNGTAISQDARTLGFYTALAHRAAAEGQLALYFLKLDGQPIAFQFGLAYGERYLAMKPGYDEAYADVSPGQLLTESLIEDCVRRGIRELDLLGDDSPSKREWTERARRHGWLFVFRDSLVGRTLHSAKFRWAPMARRMVRRWARTH
ncbi:GNAT family N-acetyltransferase [Aggregicoccus sp. 17bor-14]|uniref:GNAT family N-acetyltransferase n=1 Tax=Myxococcaceae TaxID=31 RepID=UPI00129C5FE3|nr:MULTISPECIES: GNAT family N-acetyltransferase [Myxococcaceae]MBF5040773.1 GNAT family N-acetyltransferase [Simulacricoccus sp. 17bor-14]MRI86561.1 GNAT family N-acetyltransferase [Aggregicoccus sp. 17bor-14]